MNVSVEMKSKVWNRSCLQDEVIRAGIEGGDFVEFPFHRGEHQNRSCFLQSTKLSNRLPVNLDQEINKPSNLKYWGGTASTSQTPFGVR